MNCIANRNKADPTTPLKHSICALLLSCAPLQVTSAQAQDATWTGATNGDWNTATNWAPATQPTGTATFGDSGTTRFITFSAATTLIRAIDVTSTASNYNLGIYRVIPGGPPGRRTLIINGAGIRTASGGASLGVGDDSNLWFRNSSTAGNARLSVSAFGTIFSSIPATNGITFFDTSTAGAATIVHLDGTTFFRHSSSAGTASIHSVFGHVEFFDSSTAANATIDVGGFHGRANFRDASSAGSATIISNRTTFWDRSTGGEARLIVEPGGVVDFGPSTGPNNDGKVTAGSIEGAGSFHLGSNQLTVGGNNLSTVVSGAVADGSGSGGSLVKSGSGTLTLAGANTYSGTTTVQTGTLLIDGSITSTTTVAPGAILGGAGTITGNVTNNGGLVP